MRKLYVAGWVFIALSVVLAVQRDRSQRLSPPSHTPPSAVGHPPQEDAAGWFASVRSRCNPVEVHAVHQWTPPPAGDRGASFSAACFALAGRIDEARAIIDGLQSEVRWEAAGIVFGVAHPVADAGDDRSAGPIMELVVEYWPNHYMALYHAGMGRLARGDRAGARDYLERFLQEYDVEDGFGFNARSALKQMEP